MPIKPENKSRYPATWREIRTAILDRDGHCCEKCGVPNYAVGYRNREGEFIPLRGNGPCDAAGAGKDWPSMTPITYTNALKFADAQNCCKGRRDEEGNRWIVIVLTIAHLHDPDPANCDPANLSALCQYHHLAYDRKHHAKTAYRTRRAGKVLGDLFDADL